MLRLDNPVQYLPGVGPRRALELSGAGIATIEDLLLYLPFRYEDRSRFMPVAGLRPGIAATLQVRVLAKSLHRTRSGRPLLRVRFGDDSGTLDAIWFNQPYLDASFQIGAAVVLYGAPKPDPLAPKRLQMDAPQFEKLSPRDPQAGSIHVGRIVPIYQRIGSLSSNQIRSLMHRLLPQLPAALEDPIPSAVRRRQRLLARSEALGAVHFPPAGSDVAALNLGRDPARRRLAFEEFFLLQVALALKRRGRRTEPKGAELRMTPKVRARLRQVLPFRLTEAQKRVLREIKDDLVGAQPMNRLLQGDVGSGKTIVALLVMLIAAENGYQAALMVPTELLAEQHFRNLRRLLEPTPYPPVLLTGSMRKAERERARQALASGAARIAVGTHALIQQAVAFKHLALVVVDEQHRFGVVQRADLVRKGLRPDVLVMTATPIPRSLAMTVYGDLDVSLLDQMPAGRRPVRTVLKSERSREEIYRFVARELGRGRQAYVVYPLVEESDRVELKAATKMAEELARRFRGFKVGLVHGQLKPEQRSATMLEFFAGSVQLLVCTTVIEVGVDVSNATVMVIEHAARFGLSQLHQLRGRIGRGAEGGTCILMMEPKLGREARARLEVMRETLDGFRIAERDLELRGPGDFLGTRQSGLPELKVVDVIHQRDLLEQAKREAFAWVDSLPPEPAVWKTLPPMQAIRRRWGERLRLAEMG